MSFAILRSLFRLSCRRERHHLSGSNIHPTYACPQPFSQTNCDLLALREITEVIGAVRLSPSNTARLASLRWHRVDHLRRLTLFSCCGCKEQRLSIVRPGEGINRAREATDEVWLAASQVHAFDQRFVCVRLQIGRLSGDVSQLCAARVPGETDDMAISLHQGRHFLRGNGE